MEKGKHDLKLSTNRALLGYVEWCYRSSCKCGWDSEAWTTKKRARRLYLAHKEDDQASILQTEVAPGARLSHST